ncbi:MAG: PTS sugar transporter subunit IIA [Myxococcota bacterium]|nr:PTS sugar transporter subunit IIA [Myxococcota bacterium]
MKLTDIIGLETISTDLKSSGKMDALGELGALLANRIQGVDIDIITKTLVERERLATTGVGGGIAIPHGKLAGLDAIYAAIGISRTGISFDAVDGAPVHIFVALIAPLNSSGDHLRALAKISRLLKEPDNRARFIGAQDSADLLKMVREEDEKL